MRSESRPHPTHLWTDPRVQALPISQRRMLEYLWTGPDVNGIGVTVVEPGVFQARIGEIGASIDNCLSYLESSEFVTFDRKTREVLVLDWSRFHKFSGPVGKNAYAKGMRQTSSEMLKKIAQERFWLAGHGAAKKPIAVDNSPLSPKNQAVNPPTTTPTSTSTSIPTTATTITPSDTADTGDDSSVSCGGDEDKGKTPTGTVGVEEAGQNTEEVLRNVTVADCCLQHQPALAAAATEAGLDCRCTQMLADALAGAIQAPEGAPGRLISRDNPANWLQSTATKINNSEFVENSAYLTAVANRQAHVVEVGGGGVTIAPGKYVSPSGDIYSYVGGSAVSVTKIGSKEIVGIHVVNLQSDIAAGRVMLTHVVAGDEFP